MRLRKKTNQNPNPPVQAPRLIKAEELAAREAALAESRVESQAKEPAINPALLRTPRNANEARNMFNALFNEAA